MKAQSEKRLCQLAREIQQCRARQHEEEMHEATDRARRTIARNDAVKRRALRMAHRRAAREIWGEGMILFAMCVTVLVLKLFGFI